MSPLESHRRAESTKQEPERDRLRARIAELERAERERAKTDQSTFLAEIVASSEDAIVGKTLKGVVQSWNQGAERLYGYTAEDMTGRSMALLLPPDRPDEEAAILRRIELGERVEHFETVRQRKDGRRIDVSLTISPIHSRDGGIIGASHIARNITERKLLEEQLRQTQKLESLGVLAGGIAHDFNNLLTGILGNTSAVRDALSPANPNRRLLADAIKAAERAAGLTRQLLAYAGKGRFATELLSVSDLVREIGALIQSSIPKNVLLRLELDLNLPPIEADVSQIQQVVMNLVINGAEAIGERHGTVLVTTYAQHVDQAHLRSTISGEDLATGCYAALEVHDNGCGMDEATMAKIFDPFFTTKFTGRGLGLAAVMGIVRGHKGNLKAYSAPGQGTTFKVLFPAAKLVPDQQREAAAKHSRLYGTETVLVVDDENIVRETARHALERYGYTVFVARDGHEAVEIFRQYTDRIALVLLDLTMPAMGGEEAFRNLKAIHSTVKVLLSSGFSEVEAIRPFAGKGLAGFIQKPYAAMQLVERIREALQ